MKTPLLAACRAAVLVSLASGLPLAAQAQESADSEAPAESLEPARVLVLGTYHFANPGLDVVKTDVADVLTARKQAEIDSVVEAISRFRPTRIAVEQRTETADRLDSLYEAYLSGQHELSRNETQQLGFRLAAMHELAGVHPIDHPGEFPFEAVMVYAQEHDPEFVSFVQEEFARIEAESNRRQRENTVGEILRLMNEPDSLAAGHGHYLRIASVGAGDSYVGAELLSRWYERNIHIHANLQRIAEPGDRVLVIVGAGHAPILRELITSDPRMMLVEATEYLPTAEEQR